MRAWRSFVALRGHALLARPGDLAAGMLGDLLVAASDRGGVIVGLVENPKHCGRFRSRVCAPSRPAEAA